MHGYLAMVKTEAMQRSERPIQRAEGRMLSPEEKKRFTWVMIQICSSNGFAYLPNRAK